MAFDLNRLKARRAERKNIERRPPQGPRSSLGVRCIVKPDNADPFEAEFIVVPRIGEMIDTGREQQQLRVTRVLHLVETAPAIQIDVTSTIL